MISVVIFELVFLPSLLYALWKGGWSERTAILVLAAAFTATPFVASSYWHPFRHLEVGVFAISCTSFLLLLVIALRSDKFWPLWLVAIQAQVVLSHIAPLFGQQQINSWTYHKANMLWSYLQLFLIAAATWEHQRFWAAKPASRNSGT
ncbi:MAG: hypothetical protein JWL91_2670 [Sphingomonas bacterium]|nr:hypothetical protein [Sphingomonas bacterium]MDB5690794.1 hypothetical protein [Sphingomonas bacterium]